MKYMVKTNISNFFFEIRNWAFPAIYTSLPLSIFPFYTLSFPHVIVIVLKMILLQKQYIFAQARFPLICNAMQEEAKDKGTERRNGVVMEFYIKLSRCKVNMVTLCSLLNSRAVPFSPFFSFIFAAVCIHAFSNSVLWIFLFQF